MLGRARPRGKNRYPSMLVFASFDAPMYEEASVVDASVLPKSLKCGGRADTVRHDLFLADPGSRYRYEHQEAIKVRAKHREGMLGEHMVRNVDSWVTHQRSHIERLQRNSAGDVLVCIERDLR